MTNRQWLLEQMQNMSDEEFKEMIAKSIKFFPADTDILDWLKAEHKALNILQETKMVIWLYIMATLAKKEQSGIQEDLRIIHFIALITYSNLLNGKMRKHTRYLSF